MSVAWDNPTTPSIVLGTHFTAPCTPRRDLWSAARRLRSSDAVAGENGGMLSGEPGERMARKRRTDRHILQLRSFVVGSAPRQSFLRTDSIAQWPKWSSRLCSRRSVSSGAVLSLSARVTAEVRDASVHSSDTPLLDLASAVWAHRFIRRIWPGNDQLPVDFCLFHRHFTPGQ